MFSFSRKFESLTNWSRKKGALAQLWRLEEGDGVAALEEVVPDAVELERPDVVALPQTRVGEQLIPGRNG
jgi:phage tail protein X